VETRSPDGTVTGRYGYVDPQGVLRIVDYVADRRGYRYAGTKSMRNPPNLNFKFLFSFNQKQAEDNDKVSGFADDVLHRPNPVADPAGGIAAKNAQDPVRHSAGHRFIIHESDRQHWRRRSRQHQQQHKRQQGRHITAFPFIRPLMTSS